MVRNQYKHHGCFRCGGVIAAYAGVYRYYGDQRELVHETIDGCRKFYNGLVEVTAHPLTDNTARARTGWKVKEYVHHNGVLMIVENPFDYVDTNADGERFTVYAAALRLPDRYETARYYDSLTVAA